MSNVLSLDNLARSQKARTDTALLPNNVSPLVTRELFSAMCGVAPGVVIGWCNKGLIPCVTVGKYSLINLELLRKRCLEKEFA